MSRTPLSSSHSAISDACHLQCSRLNALRRHWLTGPPSFSHTFLRTQHLAGYLSSSIKTRAMLSYLRKYISKVCLIPLIKSEISSSNYHVTSIPSIFPGSMITTKLVLRRNGTVKQIPSSTIKQLGGVQRSLPLDSYHSTYYPYSVSKFFMSPRSLHVQEFFKALATDDDNVIMLDEVSYLYLGSTAAGFVVVTVTALGVTVLSHPISSSSERQSYGVDVWWLA